jgi:hypothetical protein
MNSQTEKNQSRLKVYVMNGFPEQRSNMGLVTRNFLMNLVLGGDLLSEISKSWSMSWNMGRMALEYHMLNMLERDMHETGSLGHLHDLLRDKNACKIVCQHQSGTRH